MEKLPDPTFEDIDDEDVEFHEVDTDLEVSGITVDEENQTITTDEGLTLPIVDLEIAEDELSGRVMAGPNAEEAYLIFEFDLMDGKRSIN